MVSTWKWFSDLFWNERMWLPLDYKWTDMENGPGKVSHPDCNFFLYQIPLTVIMLIIRYVLNKTCFERLGRALGLTNKNRRKPPKIPLLEMAYQRSTNIKNVTALAKQLDIKERQVEQWWRLRRNANKLPKLTKFCEYTWKGTTTGVTTLMGLYVLWDKDYFWDLNECVIGYPHQGLTNDVWWLIALKLSIVFASVVTIFFEVRRKDFMLLLAHHFILATVFSVSWIVGWFRFGAVIVPVIDSSDCLLQIVKACLLAKFDKAGPLVFVVFFLLWFYTRMYYYLVHYIFTILAAYSIVSIWFMACFLCTLLIILYILQVYWSIIIVQVSYNYITAGIFMTAVTNGLTCFLRHGASDNLLIDDLMLGQCVTSGAQVLKYQILRFWIGVIRKAKITQ